MLIRETGTLLASMLADAGVCPTAMSASDVPTTIEIFRRFAAIPVDGAAPPEDDGDGILAQFGTFALRGPREFLVDLTRQFIEAGDTDAPTWQLSCTLYWTPSAETEVLTSGHLWSFNKTLDEFFAEAVVLPGWAWALAGGKAPRDLAITLEVI